MAFYKRAVFLINPSFQLKFSLIVCSFVFLSSMVYPLLLLEFFSELVHLHPELSKNVSAATNEFLIFLVLIQAIFIGLVFIVFVFLTHKVAGPMYKLKKHLSDIREGGPITPLTFRSGDYFTDVADEVSLYLETVSMNQENDFIYIEEVSQYLDNLSNVIPDDKKPILNEISRRLIEIQSRYK